MSSGQPVKPPLQPNGKHKPEVKPKPKVGAKHRRTNRHYENVVLHNLAESLKRKIMPRRVARSSSKSKSDIEEAELEQNPNSNGSSNNNNGQSHNNGASKSGSVEYTEVELCAPGADSGAKSQNGRVNYIEVEVPPRAGSSIRSSGLEISENELYNMQETSQ